MRDATSASTGPRFATSIAIAVVEHEDHFLVGQRPAGIALAGFWEFPGGKVRSGETTAAAAARECREETGIDVEVLQLYTDLFHDYEHGRVHLHFFACRPVDPSRPPRTQFRWIKRQDLIHYQFPAANHDLIKRLL